MLWIAIIVIVLLVIIFASKGKKKEKSVINDVQEEEKEEPCAELRKLAILYNGKYLTSGEIVEVPYNQKVMFEVQGFDITGTKEACIDESQVMWLKSCACVHWESNTGLENNVLVNNKTKNVAREVWVKYSNGITFMWKVQVI